MIRVSRNWTSSQYIWGQSKPLSLIIYKYLQALALQARGAGAPGRPCQEIAKIRQYPPGRIAITGQAVLLFQYRVFQYILFCASSSMASSNIPVVSSSSSRCPDIISAKLGALVWGW